MLDRYVGGLRVTAPEPALHLASLARLIATTFWGDAEESTLATVGDALRPGGSYSWSDSRVGLTDDGSIATHAGVVDFHMRVGDHGLLHTAGLCAILTVDQYRRRGWMRQTMNNLLANLPAAEYDVSLLFGIDRFYQQFDYRRAWPEHYFKVRRDELAEADALQLEQFQDEQPQEVVALANRHQSGQTGSAVRDGEWFTSLGEDRGYLWRDDDGVVAGFVLTRLNDEQLLVTDHAGGADQILAVTRQLLWTLNRGEARFDSLASTCELAKRLRRMNSREVIRHQSNGGALIRLVSLRSTLQKLLPDLTQRLVASAWSGWEGKLRLDTDDEHVCLKISEAAVELIEGYSQTEHEIGGPGMAQLLIGSDSFDVLVDDGGLSATGDGADLAGELFPALQPSMPEPDHF